MPEIGTSGSMSGDGKRSVGHRPQATAPILDSTESDVPAPARAVATFTSPSDFCDQMKRPLVRAPVNPLLNARQRRAAQAVRRLKKSPAEATSDAMGQEWTQL